MKDESLDPRLTELFQALGLSEPAEWAKSEQEENIPQLPMALFLKELANLVRAYQDHDDLRKSLHADPPARQALQTIRQAGIPPEALTSILRAVLTQFATDLCFLLDDTAAARFPGLPHRDLLDSIHWTLFQTSADGQPLRSMEGLHELLSEFLPPDNP